MSIKRTLLEPFHTPSLHLRNRVAMAPMSRRRSKKGIPGPSTAIYYGQRAGAGLIIAENTAVAPNGIGYLHTPGIYNEAQKAGWKRVTDEVHRKGGKIVMQLVHAGRIGHPVNHEDGSPLVAPSAVRATGSIRTLNHGHLPIPEPEGLSTEGAKALVNAHIQAAIHAVEAGFDGVEIHGAHGFLPEQFLHPLTNRRTDRYGGSIANRSRFLLEIMEGVVAAIGKERTGIRLSPFATINDLPAYEEEKATHEYIIDALHEMDILYIHLSDQPVNGKPSITPGYVKEVRERFPNLLILAGGYTADSAEAVLQAGQADLIAFGRPFIANPDLVERFRYGTSLAPGDKDTYYQGGDKGYIDYPAVYDTPVV
ncbi:alkene reductase [Sinomicrobium weinanense]|uniref:Alkene reductase n=1 Tax=Sinomicrobium weinanense TaxID=2842200 RepID=A0A926JV67_9FLAO|nr:alkene reductase [Sinomicrobium weinanense]MBC9798080.1 alkene reductase [Sinomicrobium weinanense]MBU3122558.1 alkene reductase [Sinomicrobium weinanense]